MTSWSSMAPTWIDGLLQQEIPIAILGSLLAWLAGVSVRLARERREAKRNPVAGCYASVFEDKIGGRRLEVKAAVVIKQRGRRISGETHTLSGELRSWSVVGEARKDGAVTGSYSSRDPGDVSNGVFYLERKGAGRLEGFWAGYDSVNRRVEAGRYVLRRTIDVAIRPMRQEDVDAVTALMGAALGSRYIECSDLLDMLREHEENVHCVHVAIDSDKQIVGAVISRVTAGDELHRYLPKGGFDELAALLPSLAYYKVGLLQSIAVSRVNRCAGVGSELVRASLGFLHDNGATGVLCIGWVDADGCHIEGLMKQCGFRSAGEIPAFWRADSLAKGYDCPTDGNPCTCNARVFFESRL